VGRGGAGRGARMGWAWDAPSEGNYRGCVCEGGEQGRMIAIAGGGRGREYIVVNKRGVGGRGLGDGPAWATAVRSSSRTPNGRSRRGGVEPSAERGRGRHGWRLQKVKDFLHPSVDNCVGQDVEMGFESGGWELDGKVERRGKGLAPRRVQTSRAATAVSVSAAGGRGPSGGARASTSSYS